MLALRQAEGDARGDAGRELLRGILAPDFGEQPGVDNADEVRDALWSSKVDAYAQGLDQIRKASEE